MSNIGKRIKSVILKGKSFWNWKNESNINVALPNPKDYRNKISYDTNVELIFNREAIVTKVYNDPKQIPALETLIPQGYKLLYPSNNTIQAYNNNRFVLVYDYYDLIVHYRDESNPNVDISIFKGRYQYGTLITANMINWPAGREGKDDWIEFPIGELTPARVTDRYVYLPSGTSTPETTPENMKHNTVIEMTINHTDKEYISRSSVTFIPGYIDYRYIDKYLYGRLPIGVKTNYSFKIYKGSVNNIEIGGYSDRLPEIPKAYYVGANNNITKVNYTKNGSSAQRFNVVPIIWYDKKDPLFEKFYNNNPSDIKPFFDKYLSNMIAEYITGHRVPNGTYGRPFESNNKMNIIIPSFKVFKTENNTPFIYMINKTVFDKNFNPNETKAVFNIGEVLTKVESENTDYKDYFRTKCFTIDVDRVDDNFTYTTIENFTLNGQTADLLYYLVPLDRISYIGLYTNKEKMYKHYFSSVYKENPVIDSNIASSVPSNTSGGISIFGGIKKTGYKELKNPVGPTTYEEYKSSNGDRVSFASGDYITKYKHTHNTISAKAELIRNEQEFLNNQVIDETSILIESRKEGSSGNISEDTKQKYRIHFFNELGVEMKEYLTDQWIKEGSAPSPYPPRGYIIDPDKPWTRNPNDNKEIYVYLVKKMCRITIEFNITNPDGFKHKYWAPMLGISVLHTGTYTVDTVINVAMYLENFKTTHSAKINDLAIEYSPYSTKTDLVLEDNIKITFNAKIIKNDSYTNNIKLSDARREFGIINPYFDYCLAAVIVNKNQLIPQAQFENNLTARTKDLVSLNSPTGLDSTLTATALECQIVYNNNLYLNFPSMIIPKIEVWKIKEGIRTLLETLTNVDIKNLLGVNAMGAEKLGVGTTNFRNKLIASNIAKYLVDDMNNTSWKDQFSYAYANSPEVVNNGVNLEFRIEWPDEIHRFIYENNYIVDIKLIPTALLPIFSSSQAYTEDQIGEGLDINCRYGYMNGGNNIFEFNPAKYKVARTEDVTNLTRNATGFDYTKLNACSMEAYKVMGLYTFTGTLGFLYRPYAIHQILSRPIPAVIIYRDNGIFSGVHIHQDREIRLTQANKNKHSVLTPAVISHAYSKTLPTKLCADNYMVPYYDARFDCMYIARYTNSTTKLDVVLYPTSYISDSTDMYDVFGTNNINDWFEIMTKETSVSDSDILNVYRDSIQLAREHRMSGVLSDAENDNDAVFNDIDNNTPIRTVNDIDEGPAILQTAGDLKFKTLRLTTVGVDTACANNGMFTRFTLWDRTSVRIYVRDYELNEPTPVYYINVNGNYHDDITVPVYTALSGALSGIDCFKKWIKDEVIASSIFADKKEFYIISGTMYDYFEESMNQQGLRAIIDLNTNTKFLNYEGYKEMIDRGEIVKYYGNKNIFDDDSVIDCIFVGEDTRYIGKIDMLPWHKVKTNDTIVLDFDRKYGLGISTEYSRTWIIPDLDKRLGYRYDYNNYTKNYINDSSLWTVPFHRSYDSTDLISGDVLYNTEIWTKISTYSSYGSSSRLYPGSVEPIDRDNTRYYFSIWYAILMNDIMNNPREEDQYATKVEIMKNRKTPVFKYRRYPNNNEIDNYVNIHLYNITTKDAGNAFYTASRFDYRFDPTYIRSKFFGYSLYELAMKLSSMYDFASNGRFFFTGYGSIASSRFLGNIRSSKTNTWLPISDSNESNAQLWFKSDILSNPDKQYNIIHPVLLSEISVDKIYSTKFGVYNPVLNKNDSINGINKDTPEITAGYFQHGIWNKYTEDQIPWKRAYNPYTYTRDKSGNQTAVTYEDIFRKAYDPYTGYRAFGTSRDYDAGRHIHNFGFAYDDPRFLQAFWLHRTSKAFKYPGIGQDTTEYANKPNPTPNDLTDPNAAGNYFNLLDSWFDGIQNSRVNNTSTKDTRMYVMGGKGAYIFHPMTIKYVAHPMQRTAFLSVFLVWSGSDVSNQNKYDFPTSMIYCGYVNFNTVEIDKRKPNKIELTNYIKECMLRDNSGYKEFVRDIRYKYIVDESKRKIYSWNPINLIDRLEIEYIENFDSTDPNYKFTIRAYVKAEITGSDTINLNNLAHAKIVNYRSINIARTSASAAFLTRAGAESDGVANVANWDNIIRGINYFGTASVTKSEADINTGTPVIYSNKYSCFTVDENGWSSFDGQWLPKWPSIIPDALLIKCGQLNFTLDASKFKPKIKNYGDIAVNLVAGNMINLYTNMYHPYYSGWRDNRIKNAENIKFYGSVDLTFMSTNQNNNMYNKEGTYDPIVSFSGTTRNINYIANFGERQTGIDRMSYSWLGWLNGYINNSYTKAVTARTLQKFPDFKPFKSKDKGFESEKFKWEDFFTDNVSGLKNDMTTPGVKLENVDENNPNGVFCHIDPASVSLVYATYRSYDKPQSYYVTLARFDVRDYDADYYNNSKKWTYVNNSKSPVKELAIGVNEAYPSGFTSVLPISEKL